MMKIFTCNDHEGHYPVGVASIIVADHEKEARLMLIEKLADIGIKADNDFSLVELDVSKKQVSVLCDGNY